MAAEKMVLDQFEGRGSGPVETAAASPQGRLNRALPLGCSWATCGQPVPPGVRLLGSRSHSLRAEGERLDRGGCVAWTAVPWSCDSGQRECRHHTSLSLLPRRTTPRTQHTAHTVHAILPATAAPLRASSSPRQAHHHTLLHTHENVVASSLPSRGGSAAAGAGLRQAHRRAPDVRPADQEGTRAGTRECTASLSARAGRGKKKPLGRR